MTTFFKDLFRATVEESRVSAAGWKGGAVQEACHSAGSLDEESGARTAETLRIGATSPFFAAMIADRVAWACWFLANADASNTPEVEATVNQAEAREAGRTIGLNAAIDRACKGMAPFLKTLAAMQLAALEADRVRVRSSSTRSLIASQFGGASGSTYESRLAPWFDEVQLAASLRQYAADLAAERQAAQDAASGVWTPSVY